MLQRHIGRVGMCLVVLGSLIVSVAAQDGVLTNDDIVKMVRAQLATNIIRGTIEASNAKFDLSPTGLIALKESGVSEDLQRPHPNEDAQHRQGHREHIEWGECPRKIRPSRELEGSRRDPAQLQTVNYTFAWDYPFALKHQNTSVVLLSGKGSGPFSGPAGATSVASELVKALQPYRVAGGQK